MLAGIEQSLCYCCCLQSQDDTVLQSVTGSVLCNILSYMKSSSVGHHFASTALPSVLSELLQRVKEKVTFYHCSGIPSSHCCMLVKWWISRHGLRTTSSVLIKLLLEHATSWLLSVSHYLFTFIFAAWYYASVPRGLCRHAVPTCLSVTFMNSVKTNKTISSDFFTIR